MMRYFLDMNLPIYFCMQIGNPLEEKTKLFIKNKGNNSYLLCDYIVKKNLPKWLSRQQIILFEFNQKIKNKDYLLFSTEQSKILIYDKSKDKTKFIEAVNEIFNLLPARINYFIKVYIDEIVIPELEIDFKLKSCLFTWLNPNDSDANTIASAIQEHNKKELKIMTADKKDWKKELLEEVHEDLFLKKGYPKLPKIEYLQDL